MMNRRIRRFLADWVVPPGFVRLKQRIDFERLFMLTNEESAVLSRNAKFQNMYAGRRCFVIGNGPSLSRQDLTPLGDEITIVMNSFNRHPILEKWKPTFYCKGDPSYDSPERIATIPKCLERIEAQAYFYHIETKRIFDRHRFLDPERVYFLKMVGPPSENSELDLTKPIPGYQDTSIMALMIALAMGCSPIYLLGVDYDWLSHRSLDRHFYGTDDPISRYDLGSESYLHSMKIGIICWSSHEQLREIGLVRGQKIFNATEGGFLDIYPRITLAEAIAGHSAL